MLVATLIIIPIKILDTCNVFALYKLFATDEEVADQPLHDGVRVGNEVHHGDADAAVHKRERLCKCLRGINEPRYVSIMGIKKARKKELTVIPVADLGLAEDDLAPRTRIEQIFLPPETTGAEMIQGDAASVATELIRIIKEKGVNI